ncbi:hypothetical protein [Erwinia psidii]|uniref:Uncharacterized protein n=1 Tax=Erwinia psidii TaxID=69224 RepID=A0A3N6UU02_9GAMM|nr:hypothetical protein [Erwinia psidii]MCX8959585.1 hypothetical protein [Erwinia psidii]MCX8963435.1 hypothetical protein [Erwinia psidii]RQM36325.1 hypothetical protein EB241_21145 [Erwinia psidii]
MDEYVYHITKKEVALTHIKAGGLKPAAQISGASVARSEGAFASDRDKTLRVKELSQLKLALWNGSKKGYTLEKIKNKSYAFIPISFEFTGDSDAENTALRKLADDFYKQYFSPIAGSDLKMKVKDLQQPAEEMLRDHPNHALCQFAKEYTRLDFAIEERATSNHIYFFPAKYASDCYGDYTKHHGGAILCRVLRVKRSTINHLEQDMAEYRGLKTKESVAPLSVEIYDAEGSPFDTSAGDHWRSLTQV